MNITTLIFMIFLMAGLLIYYLIPSRFQWQCLLGLSFVFLWAADWRNLLFVGYVAAICYGFAIYIERMLSEADLPEDRAERKIAKGARARKAKRAVLLAIFLLILILVLSKYVPAALHLNLTSVNETLQSRWRFLKLIVPFGLSYYLLMAISYLLDVYWQRGKADHSFFHLVLFICYFPQLTQGPIGTYGQMKGELFKDHGEAWENIKVGLPLMLWGFFKKMVIADRTAVFVDRANSGSQYGLNVLICLVLYGIQLYCDFSGGIDVVRGVSECFGVRLGENFRQPYFSKDLGEFWRRWHISLGAFMKNYIFFPLAMWKPLKLLKKQLRKHMSMKMASKIIVAIGDLIVFLIVGIWHGAGSKYAGWGIYNGAILAFSAVMEDVYRSWKNALHINEQSGRWQTFRLVRTLVIVTIGWVFDCADTASGAVRMFFRMFVLNRTSLGRIFTTKVETLFYLPILFLACMLLLWVDIQHEKGISLRQSIAARPFWKQAAIWTALFQAILLVGRTVGAGGFMYANF